MRSSVAFAVGDVACQPRSRGRASLGTARSPPADAKLPPSALPLEFVPHEHVALVGNSLAERMNLFGNFETLLHTRFPKLGTGRPQFRPAVRRGRHRAAAEQLHGDRRSAEGFRPRYVSVLLRLQRSRLPAPAGEEQFRDGVRKYLDEMAQQYPRARWRAAAVRADFADCLGADGQSALAGCERSATRACAATRRSSPKWPASAAWRSSICSRRPNRCLREKPGMQFTINGCHLNEAGDREVAVLLDRALFGETTAANLDSDAFQKLRAAVNDKSWVHLQDYRMLNGWYVYGGRRTWDTETFPREYQKDSRDGRRARSLRLGPRARQSRRRRRTTARPASWSCRRRGSAIRSRITRSRRS